MKIDNAGSDDGAAGIDLLPTFALFEMRKLFDSAISYAHIHASPRQTRPINDQPATDD